MQKSLGLYIGTFLADDDDDAARCGSYGVLCEMVLLLPKAPESQRRT